MINKHQTTNILFFFDFQMDDLQRLLCSVKEDPIEFSSDGAIEQPPFPGLKIEDIGEISLPLLCSSKTKEIIDVIQRKSSKAKTVQRFQTFLFLPF